MPSNGIGSEEGPPPLDDLLARFFKKLAGKSKLPFAKASPVSPSPNYLVFGFVLFLFISLWALSCIFIVSPAERAVLLRFGQYKTTVGPGLHWMPYFIDSRTLVNIQRIAAFSYKSEMLTKDENIVTVSLSVQYRVEDPQAFLFNVISPIASLQQATASALRQVVGHTNLDDILTTGRAQLREEVAQQLQSILTPYQTGLVITDVTLQPAQPPEQVTAAFDDAINAREDEQRYINQAQTYAEKVIPIAQGQAARIYQAAVASKQQMILQAKGAIAGYLALLPSYEKLPELTRKRLYLDTMEAALSQNNTVILDNNTKGNNTMVYLPLDKLEKNKLENTSIPAALPIPNEQNQQKAGNNTNSSAPAFPDRPSYSSISP